MPSNIPLALHCFRHPLTQFDLSIVGLGFNLQTERGADPDRQQAEADLRSNR